MTGWAAWEGCLQNNQGEGAVAEAGQWDQSCYAERNHWAAEASSGFCKCSG